MLLFGISKRCLNNRTKPCLYFRPSQMDTDSSVVSIPLFEFHIVNEVVTGCITTGLGVTTLIALAVGIIYLIDPLLSTLQHGKIDFPFFKQTAALTNGTLL